ncbi:hypothetical protein BDV30DRAFT_108452 [Aspergillus minisclerotigenes]|uniref:Uncharacterized protein n=1 Tax=Aspergillus minisclerotigenes TaxID=656917 RepID=A0A5N6J706_9EURO|nr:hypothetical protein BDV30DRAFT_108452 [Aspergillus minisclerotigenes]
MRFFGIRLQKPHTSVLYLLYHCFALLYVQHLFRLVNKRRTKRRKEEKRKKEDALPIYQAIHKSADLETHQDG